MPDPDLAPPTIAEPGDPFTSLRVIDLIARLERGRPVRIADMAARLDAAYLEWLFPEPVIVDVLVQLQANWFTDYRNQSGIVLADDPYGTTVSIEDSSRVDPWIVRQAQRAAAECREQLAEFSRLDRPTGG
jgi:flavin-dependent dehydrogenase